MARQPGWNIAGAVTKIDHLVCVADADRAAECCRAAGSAPSAGQDSATWVRNAETEWTKQLRDAAPVAPDRVHGRFLRWSLESALLALFDEPAALGWMARPDGAALGGFLSRCGPDPRTLTPPSSFTDHFHDPQRCLRDLVAATNINSKVLSLSSAGRTFALEAAGGDDRARSRVLDRVPDLRAVASLIIGLG
ncbi:MAG: hypothetical protein HY905_13765 [Deltaproteobacteria bacterium]|nr:hypothetical protein [Deltaproteobacteria bacterium]